RPGVGNPVAPAGMSRRRRQDLPSSWGTPSVRLPCSVDAGRTAVTRPLQCRSVAPGMCKAEAPATGLSTLNSTAFGLAVYASPPGLPHATQDSLPAAGQALLGGRSPAGLLRKVSECFLHLILLPRALLGATTSTAGTCGSAMVAPSPRLRSPADGWSGVARERSPTGCETRPSRRWPDTLVTPGP